MKLQKLTLGPTVCPMRHLKLIFLLKRIHWTYLVDEHLSSQSGKNVGPNDGPSIACIAGHLAVLAVLVMSPQWVTAKVGQQRDS